MSFFYDEEVPRGFQDADIQQAQYEEEGRRFVRAMSRMEALRAEGKLDEAAAACPHDGGYPLDSPAAQDCDDPNAGEPGVRCGACGSRMSDWSWSGGMVLVPCQLR